jgi:hypothetical protein
MVKIPSRTGEWETPISRDEFPMLHHAFSRGCLLIVFGAPGIVF